MFILDQTTVSKCFLYSIAVISAFIQVSGNAYRGFFIFDINAIFKHRAVWYLLL